MIFHQSKCTVNDEGGNGQSRKLRGRWDDYNDDIMYLIYREVK